MGSEILELEDVSRVFNAGLPNEVRVLNSLNLNIQEGEVVALISPSGSGKSTLLNIAGLLDQPTSGKVFIDAREIDRADDGYRTKLRREKVGFVFQFHHLLAEFSAIENVQMPALGVGWDKSSAHARAKELLEVMGLGDRLHHRPSSLSGGEQQRVAVCRAIMNRPKLLLADEPTGNLDPGNSTAVFDTFIKLAREEGLAALVATHNLEIASKMDRVIDLREINKYV